MSCCKPSPSDRNAAGALVKAGTALELQGRLNRPVPQLAEAWQAAWHPDSMAGVSFLPAAVVMHFYLAADGRHTSREKQI